jgi:hypothetical protein
MLVLLIYIKFGHTKLDNVKLAVRHFIIFKFVKIIRKVVHKLPPAPQWRLLCEVVLHIISNWST